MLIAILRCLFDTVDFQRDRKWAASMDVERYQLTSSTGPEVRLDREYRSAEQREGTSCSDKMRGRSAFPTEKECLRPRHSQKQD